jgi:hypothetical protein
MLFGFENSIIQKENFLVTQLTLKGYCRKNFNGGCQFFFHNLNKHGQLVSGTRRSGRLAGRFGRNRPLKIVVFLRIFATFEGRCRPNGWTDCRQPHIP